MKQRMSKDLVRRRYSEHLANDYDKDGIEATFRMGLQLLVFYDLMDYNTFEKRLNKFYERG